MLVKTKHFGDIDIDESKIIIFENGIFGFEDCKKFTLIYDSESDEKPVISWLQSIEESALALPVMNPFLIKPDYNPTVEDEVLWPLGESEEEDLVLLVTVTVPRDVEQMTANLKAPLVLNTETRKGVQVVVENSEYEIKFPVFEILQESAQKGGA